MILPQVLVLLDVTPDQAMVDEGVAREVINRIQKLRKKVSVPCRVTMTDSDEHWALEVW